MSDVRKRLLTVLAVAAVGILLADRLVLTPLTRHWQKQGIRIAELRESLDRGELLMERSDILHSRWEGMQGDALAGSASSAEQAVLKAAARWASESRILLTGMTPQWRSTEDGYQILEWRATAQGDLRAITRFLLELEKDPMAVRLESCEVSARDARGDELGLSARFSALQMGTPEEPSS